MSIKRRDKTRDNVPELLEVWRSAWPDALADWSPYIQMRDPIWCTSTKDEKREGLTGSFAMIRLVDHRIVISLRQVMDLGIEQFATEVLAHEIGHHVYCPADLTDNARLLARIRRGLPGCEAFAPMVSNLYSDLLINDRLQRGCGRNMAAVYQAIRQPIENSLLWKLYLRIYELLWNLPALTLTSGFMDSRVNQDAVLGMRLVRSYSKDWLSGAGRFACLLFPYVAEEAEKARKAFLIWGDALEAGAGGFPDGLIEIDDDEETGTIHPVEDPELSGLAPIDLGELDAGDGRGRLPGALSGRKTIKQFRSPFEYAELIQASGTNLDLREIAVRYYREMALPHVIPFPARLSPTVTDPMPEGLELWDLDSELEKVDWVGSLIASPVIIPGITTRERLIGQSPGSEPHKIPLDLYLGVDCSGSMGDPARTLSYPVLAGAVMAISARRAGAEVKVVLSGEPGKSISTDGFIKDERIVLRTLVNYLGTGYSFGIHRLRETFGEDHKIKRPAHILILSDYDMFAMLDETGDGVVGWDVAKAAVERSGGGATYVLQLPGWQNIGDRFDESLNRMRADGWHVHLVNSMEELVDFARQFSRSNYARLK